MCYDRLDTLFLKNPLTTVIGTVKQQIIGSIILIEQEQESMQACRCTILITTTAQHMDMCLISDTQTEFEGITEHTHSQARHLLTILCVMTGLILYLLKIL